MILYYKNNCVKVDVWQSWEIYIIERKAIKLLYNISNNMKKDLIKAVLAKVIVEVIVLIVKAIM